MNCYATLDELRAMLRLDAAQTSDDALLLGALRAASRLIDAFTGRHFTPQRATRTYTVTDPSRLLLDGDLLTLHSVINGDGAALPLDAIHLQPAGQAVKSSLVLDPAQVVFTHDGDPVDAVTVEGTWGFHPNWPDAWFDPADTVQNDPLDVGGESLLVTDSDASGLMGVGRCFAAGQLLRIGDEYLHLLAVDTTTDTLTVSRGANGTAAVMHTQGAAIAIYRPPDDVRQACLRVAHWLYKQPDAGFVQRAGGLRGQVTVPAALPDDVQQILTPYTRVRVA